MLGRQIYLDEIINFFCQLERRIKEKNKLNLQDENIFSENILSNILNIIYKIKTVNANKEKSNFEGIDLINKQNLIALQFLYEMVKRIRKYNGIMYVITQNINDFVGSNEIKREAEAILNNCDYQFVHHLADKDLQDYNSIVQGGLNNDELNSIKKADQGECLLTIGSNKRTFLSIEATEEEKNAWENKEW